MVNVGIDYGDACRVFKTVFLRWHVCFTITRGVLRRESTCFQRLIAYASYSKTSVKWRTEAKHSKTTNIGKLFHQITQHVN